MSEKSWANPTGAKKEKPKGGWTKPDYSVRCPKCSVGVGEGGVKVGTLVSRFDIGVVIDGRPVKIGRFGRCGNLACLYVTELRITEQAENLGIKAINVLRVIKQSRAALPDYTLEELRRGEREVIEAPFKQGEEEQVFRETIIKSPEDMNAAETPLF